MPRLFDRPVALILESISHRTGDELDASDGAHKIVDLGLVLDPFPPELASQLHRDVGPILFSNASGLPRRRIKSLEFNLALPGQTLTVYHVAVSDPPELVLDDIDVSRPRVRLSKSEASFALRLRVTIIDPDPEQLEGIVLWHTEQRVVTFTESALSLPFEDDDKTLTVDEARDRMSIAAGDE